ncbi:MAG: 5'-nucleotidase C-terminal domain-containing protein [Pseudomonadota bacterium]
MLKIKTGLLLVFFLFWAEGCSQTGGYAPLEQGEVHALTILHVNDTHSQLEEGRYAVKIDLGRGPETFYFFLGSQARLTAKVRELMDTEKNPIFLHAGDLVQGTIYYTKYHGVAGVSLMNLTPPQAMVVGNHEFDVGPERLFNIINQADFPILGGNVDASADPFLSGRLPAYVIEDIDGERVGIIGLITPETAHSSQPGKTISFVDPRETAARLVAELESQGVNKIIALTHQGYGEDRELARRVPGIDVIIGGHSHTLLGDFSALGLDSAGPYPTRETGPDGSLVCIGQDWKWGVGLGVMNVKFDREGKTISCDGSPVLLASDRFLDQDKNEVSAETKAELTAFISKTPIVEIVEPDREAAAILAPFTAGLVEYRKTVIATMAENLWHVRVPGQTHPEGGVMAHGSLVSPHISAALLWQANREGLQADAALDNAGDAHADLPLGDLTVAAVYELLPFGNTIYLLQVTGADLTAALERGVTLGDGSFLYPAGLRYKADLNLPEGQRITVVEIRDAGGVFRPLDRAATYRLAVNSYMANGGGGFDLFNNPEIKKYDTGFFDAEMFQEYASQNTPLVALEPLIEYTPARK